MLPQLLASHDMSEFRHEDHYKFDTLIASIFVLLCQSSIHSGVD